MQSAILLLAHGTPNLLSEMKDYLESFFRRIATPESIKKHLNPVTPAWCRGRSASWFPGTTPPQNAE